MALDTYALTTLEAANYELGLTADGGAVDAYIENLINRASDIIESALLRKFKIRLYVKERHDGNDRVKLYLNQYPILAVNLDELVWDAAGKTLTRNDGGSFVKDGFADGNKVLIQNSDLNSGLLTIAIAVTALVITFSDVIVDDTEDNNVIISHFRELWIEDSKIDGDDYEMQDNYIYYNSCFSKGSGNIRATYYAGYLTIPDDIVDKCLELIKMAYDKEKDVKSEKLGPYSITFFDNKAEIIEKIRTDLSTYINVGAL